MNNMNIVTIRGHTFLADSLDEGSVVVDLGAHNGEFSREVHRRFNCQCHMVEALPDLFAQIATDSALHKYHYAMTGTDGPVTLFVSANPEANSITKTVASATDSVQVEGLSLASFMQRTGLKHIDLLKVDIEGAEIALLESASTDVLAAIDQITVEFHDFIPGLIDSNQVESIKRKLNESKFYGIKFSHHMNTDVLFINQRFGRIGRLGYWYLKYLAKYVRASFRALRRRLS